MARSDREKERWRYRHPTSGAELIFTTRNRLLSRPSRGARVVVLFPKVTEAGALAEAARRGMSRA